MVSDLTTTVYLVLNQGSDDITPTETTLRSKYSLSP